MPMRQRLRWILVGPLVVTAAVGRLSAAPVPAPPADLAALPRDASSIFSLRVADVWNSDGAKVLRELAPGAFLEVFLAELGAGSISSPTQVERLVFVGFEGERFCGALTVRDPEVLPRMIQKEFSAVEERRLRGRRYWRRETDWKGLLLLDQRSALLGAPDILEVRVAEPGASPKGLLAEAVAEVPRHDFVLAGRLGGGPGLLATLHRHLGSTDAARPLQKADFVLLRIDLRKGLDVDCRFDFSNAIAAEKALPAMRATRSQLAEALTRLASAAEERSKEGKEECRHWLAIVAFCQKTTEAVKGAAVDRSGASVSLSFHSACGAAATGCWMVMMRALLVEFSSTLPARADPPAVVHLRTVAKALRAYQAARGCLPPAAVFDKDGKALLSWRVLLLPYLGEEKLHKEFHLDEPWDSRHNIQLVPKMPAVFGKGTDSDQPPTTCFRVFTGKGALFDGQRGVAWGDVKDPAERLLVVEAATAVPWSKPEELPLPEKGIIPELGSIERCLAAFADGTVEHLYTGRVVQEERDREGKTVQKRKDGQEIAERRELLRQAIRRDGTKADRAKLRSVASGANSSPRDPFELPGTPPRPR
jgi:hypothetical protein